MYDLYEALVKGKPDKVGLRQAAYFSDCLSVDLSMFRVSIDGEYLLTDTTGNTLDPLWIERYLNTAGCILSKVSGNNIIIAPQPSRTGELDQYGDGKDGFGVTRNGEQITGTIGKDVCLCYNQSSRFSDLDLLWFPDLLAKIDDGIDACLTWSKPAPVFSAADSKAHKTIADNLQKIMDGEPCIVTGGDVLTSMRQGQNYAVDFTNPERVRNIQYLSELFDEAVKWFYTKRGVDVHRTAKHAQVTASESDGMQVYSWIHPLDKLRCRQQWCDDMQRLFGVTITYDFNEPWRSAYEQFMMSMTMPEPEQKEGEQNADTDNTDDDSADESGNS